MKKTAIILILSMLISLLVGCGGTKAPENESGNNSDSLPPISGDNSGENDDISDVGGENGDNISDSKPNDGENDPTEGGESKPDDSEGDPSDGNESDPNEGNTEEKPEKPPVGTSSGYSLGHVELTAMDGSKINAADYEGKIIVINVWATWCGPCTSELPDFDRIATELKDEVVIIAAHCNYMYSNASSYVSSYYADSDIVFCYDLYNEAYSAIGGDGYVPYTAVINADGVIVYAASGGLSYASLLYLINSAK